MLRGVSQLKGVTRVGILYTALGFLERDRDVRSLSEFISRPHDHVKMCARLEVCAVRPFAESSVLSSGRLHAKGYTLAHHLLSGSPRRSAHGGGTPGPGLPAVTRLNA